jgi:hypothetical protein
MSLTTPGFRVWTGADVDGILAGVGVALFGIVNAIPNTPETRAYAAGVDIALSAIYAGFGRSRPDEQIKLIRSKLAYIESDSSGVLDTMQ